MEGTRKITLLIVLVVEFQLIADPLDERRSEEREDFRERREAIERMRFVKEVILCDMW